MKVKLIDPNFSQSLNTSLARGGELFKNKNGSIRRGDLLEVTKSGFGNWTNWSASIGDTLGNKLDNANVKGNPAEGDLYLVKNADRVDVDAFQISYAGKVGEMTDTGGNNYVYSSAENSIMFDVSNPFSVWMDTASGGNSPGDVSGQVSSSIDYVAGDQYCVFVSMWDMSSIGQGNEVALPHESNVIQFARDAGEATGGTTDITNGSASLDFEYAFAQDKQYVFMCRVYLLRGGSTMDATIGFGWDSFSAYYDYQTTASTTPDTWLVQLQYSMGSSQTILKDSSGNEATLLSNDGSAGGKTFTWDVVMEDYDVLGANFADQAGVGPHLTATGSDTDLWWRYSFNHQFDLDSSTAPSAPLTITATVTNAQGATGDTKEINIKLPTEYTSPDPASAGYAITSTVPVTVFDHTGGTLLTNPTSKVSILVKQIQSGTTYWFSKSDWLGQAWNPTTNAMTFNIDMTALQNYTGAGASNQFVLFDKMLKDGTFGGSVDIVPGIPVEIFTFFDPANTQGWSGNGGASDTYTKSGQIWYMESGEIMLLQTYQGILLDSMADTFIGNDIAITWTDESL